MADAKRWLELGLVMGFALGAAQACEVGLNADHCESSAVPCTGGLVCDPCTRASLSPGGDGCVDPGVALCADSSGSTTSDVSSTLGMDTSSTTDDPVTTIDLDSTTTSSDTETDSTTGPPPMCSAPDGTYGAEPCPDTDPFCVGGMCTACNNAVSDTSCFEHDEAPGDVCAADGRCVVCTPDEDSACELDVANPYCDPETNQCAPCSEHEHCGMAACNLFNGQCVPGMVVTVLPGPGALLAAVNAVTAAGGGTIIVNEGTYDEAISIGGGAIVAFLSEAGASPEWQRTAGLGAPQLRVTGGATVLVDGIDFRVNDSNTDPAIRIDTAGSRFWVDRSAIVQNFGIGVRAEGAAELMMRNCFVGGASNIDALDITGATATILYSTIGAAFGSSNAISCDATATVTVSDSIIIAQDSTAELACEIDTADHIITNTMVVPGTGNMAIGSTDEMWFVGYGADFHLMGDGVTTFATLGEWNIDDPTVDIDGDPRPTTDPSEDYVGADIP